MLRSRFKVDLAKVSAGSGEEGPMHWMNGAKGIVLAFPGYANPVFRWELGLKTKNGKPVSHRYNCLPLLASAPGGVQQELVVLICRCKATGFLASVKAGRKKIGYCVEQYLFAGRIAYPGDGEERDSIQYFNPGGKYVVNFHCGDRNFAGKSLLCAIS
jgi:hypothetical protein